MKKSSLLILLVSIGILGALFYALYVGGSSLVRSVAGDSAPPASDSGKGIVGNRLPYFDLPNLAGDHTRSSDFTDTPLVVVFWTTWNTEAADEMHIVDQYLTDHPSQATLVKVLAIDSQEERSIVSSFMSRGGYQVPTLLDVQGLTSTAYAIKSVPTFFFVDRTGVVQSISSGLLSEAVLMNKIETILQ